MVYGVGSASKKNVDTNTILTLYHFGNIPPAGRYLYRVLCPLYYWYCISTLILFKIYMYYILYMQYVWFTSVPVSHRHDTHASPSHPLYYIKVEIPRSIELGERWSSSLRQVRSYGSCLIIIIIIVLLSCACTTCRVSRTATTAVTSPTKRGTLSDFRNLACSVDLTTKSSWVDSTTVPYSFVLYSTTGVVALGWLPRRSGDWTIRRRERNRSNNNKLAYTN